MLKSLIKLCFGAKHHGLLDKPPINSNKLNAVTKHSEISHINQWQEWPFALCFVSFCARASYFTRWRAYWTPRVFLQLSKFDHEKRRREPLMENLDSYGDWVSGGHFTTANPEFLRVSLNDIRIFSSRWAFEKSPELSNFPKKCKTSADMNESTCERSNNDVDQIEYCQVEFRMGTLISLHYSIKHI